MSLWRQFRRGLRALMRRSTTDQEITDEVEHYLEQATASYMACGLSAQEARRAARIELGSETSVREQIRSFGWENLVEALFADVRLAGRRMRLEPGFTAVTILTMALGVGCATAVFSAVNPVLFESLPYPQAERISMSWEVGSDGARNDGSFGMYRELSTRARSFEGMAVFKPWQPTMTGPGQPERIEGQRVSAGYFEVLGVSPALGRLIQSGDDRAGGPDVVLLSAALWQRRFAGDSSIVGRTITLDETAYVVIGVMPAGFENVLAPAAEMWGPLQYDMSQGRAWGHHLRMVARLRRDASYRTATQELNSLGSAIVRELQPPTYSRSTLFLAEPLRDELTRAVKPALLAIMGAVTLLLAIACVNVTNLLLARTARRRGEFALRTALGAGRARLIRQGITESLFLAGLSGIVAMAVAFLGVRALIVLSPADLPRVHAIVVDRAVFAFALGMTTLVGLVCALIPALHVSRSDPQRNLQRVSRRETGGPGRTRSALVVAEIALALMLLASSGLLLRSMQRMFAIDAGFNAANLLTMQVQVSGQRFSTDSTTYRFFAQALAEVRRVPGVTAAALTSQLPLSGDLDLYGVEFVPSPAADPGDLKGTFRYAVSPGYLETMRIPLRNGRLLNEDDDQDAPRVALISESLAKRRLPGLDPLGHQLRIGSGPLYTVVGVVGDIRQQSLALNDSEAVYVTATQWRFADNVMSLVIRARGDAAELSEPVRQAVWSIDKDQPVVRAATMSTLLAASASERRFALILFQVFASAALALATAGIFALLSGSVTERTREIGIRSALGASRTHILALVIGQGMRLTGLGVLIGLAGAVLASRAMLTMLFATSPLDSLTYISVIALLTAVSLLACSLPAWRAAKVDPVRTLREA